VLRLLHLLRKLLDLRAGETRLVAPLMAVAMLVVAAQMLSKIAVDAVFVTSFNLEQISGFIVVAAIARTALTFGYGALARARGLRSGYIALTSVGVITGALAALLGVRWHPVVYATCVSLLIVPVAASEAISAASESFPARQGKRLVPLVAACSSIGGIAAGLVARLFVEQIGTAGLVAIAAALLAGGGLVSRLGASRSALKDGAPAPLVRTSAPVASIPIVQVAVLFALLVEASSQLSGYVFNTTLKAHFTRADDMAAFIGVFELALSAGVIVVQMLVTSRITGRFGVRTTLQMHPASMVLAAPVFAFAPGVLTATVTKYVGELLRLGAVTPTRTQLIAPLDPPSRSRASLLVRGAVPLGGALTGGVLAALGLRKAPAPHLLGGLLLITAILGTIVLLRARRAYTEALARSLGEGRLSLDVPREQRAALTSGLRSMLGEAGRTGDLARALQILSLMGNDVTREDIAELLSHAQPSADMGIERQVLAAARRIGARVDATRVAHAMERTLDDATAPGAALRFEALRAAGLTSEEGRLQLQAAVDEGLRSPHGHVFAAAAGTAMSGNASAYVERLVAQLVSGPHFGPAGRALALAGESAVGPVATVLPKAGTWAARVLAHLGPRACHALLERWSDLDHRTRTAAARSLAVVPDAWRPSMDGPVIERAIDTTLTAAESLTRALPRGRSPVLEREVRCRITACAEQAVNLASIVGDRKRIAKARSALAREGRARADALELLEEVLPKAFARRTLSVLELDGERRGAGDEGSRDADANGARRGRDAWLDTCSLYDRGALSSADVITLIDKLVVLGESSLFAGMTSEELYPVGQIAVTVDLEPGQAAVRQGDPGDAVFVVVSGTLEVKKGGRTLREMSRGAVFGEMALLDGAPRSASIEARTQASVLKIPRAEFDALLDEYPEIARGIIRTLIGHLRGQG
jgi:hypothetical protein